MGSEFRDIATPADLKFLAVFHKLTEDIDHEAELAEWSMSSVSCVEDSKENLRISRVAMWHGTPLAHSKAQHRRVKPCCGQTAATRRNLLRFSFDTAWLQILQRQPTSKSYEKSSALPKRVVCGHSTSYAPASER